jgi:hypothetical protein
MVNCLFVKKIIGLKNNFMPTKKNGANGFGVSVIFILSIVVLILIFVLFTRDQSAKTVESTLTNLAQTNAELQKAQQAEKTKTVADRLKDAGIDPKTVWQLGECKEPYCQFTQLATKDGEVSAVRGIERWSGYYEAYKDEKGECEAFVFGEEKRRGINMELLASLEKKLVKGSRKDDPIELTVFTHENKLVEHPCDEPSYVLNVHFE